MKVRPFSAAELLRQDSPRKYASQSNRFATLRDKSPAPGTGTGSRFRYPSVKRKTEESVSYSDASAKNLPQAQSHVDSAQVLEIVGVSTAKVNPLTPETFFASDLHDFLKCCSCQTPEKELREK